MHPPHDVTRNAGGGCGPLRYARPGLCMPRVFRGLGFSGLDTSKPRDPGLTSVFFGEYIPSESLTFPMGINLRKNRTIAYSGFVCCLCVAVSCFLQNCSIEFRSICSTKNACSVLLLMLAWHHPQCQLSKAQPIQEVRRGHGRGHQPAPEHVTWLWFVNPGMDGSPPSLAACTHLLHQLADLWARSHAHEAGWPLE